MADDAAPRARYGEAFWRAHHEARRRSDLNRREYCESQGLSMKAFENWPAKFKAEPQLLARKLLYRRGGTSHSLGPLQVALLVTRLILFSRRRRSDRDAAALLVDMVSQAGATSPS